MHHFIEARPCQRVVVPTCYTLASHGFSYRCLYLPLLHYHQSCLAQDFLADFIVRGMIGDKYALRRLRVIESFLGFPVEAATLQHDQNSVPAKFLRLFALLWQAISIVITR